MSNETILKTDLAKEHWYRKYRAKNENTFLDTANRICKALASVEKDKDYWYPKFMQTMLKYEGDTPTGIKTAMGGRITANIGTEYNGATLMNCFIQGPVKSATISYNRGCDVGLLIPIKIETPETPDNMANIFLTVMEQAMTLSSEGGWGMDFSWIRPRGSKIGGTGVRHPGVPTFMEVFDAVASCVVKGDGDGYSDILKNYLSEEDVNKVKGDVIKEIRKGALMGVLRVDHPDIEEFVRAKQKPGVLTKFNLSVGITDEFMNAVINDDKWELKFENKVYKIVSAKELYNLIMESTYNRAEPGVIFLDTMQLNNPISYMGKVNATNPCCRKGSIVSTKNGVSLVENVLIGDQIQTTLGYGGVNTIEVHEDEDIYRVSFSDGFYQDVTIGHIFHTMIGSDCRKVWNKSVRLSDLNVGDYVRKQWYKSYPCVDNTLSRDDGLLIGLYLGDGCYSNSQGFNISVNSEEDNSYITSLFTRFGGSYRIDSSEGMCERIYLIGVNDKINTLFSKFSLVDKQFDLVSLLNTNKDFICGLIDGLISSDGNVNLSGRYPQVRFKNNSYDIHTLMKHLMLFVKSDYKVYTAGKKGETSTIYGRVVKRSADIYEGVIDNDSIMNMYDAIGYISHIDKNVDLKKVVTTTQLNGVKWKTKITNIEYVGKDVVYDLYEPVADDWNHSGYVSRGCGEIPGNPETTTVCLLGSVNLTQYIGLDRVFDFNTYTEDVATFARMLDNVCDLTNLPLPSYEWSVKNLRQYGMGVIGVGSALIMMGIEYGSKESIEFVEKITKIKENVTIKTSALLAKEKGKCGAFTDEYFNTEYFKSDRLDEDVKALVRLYGVRNAKTTTNAPTGNCVRYDTTMVHTEFGVKSFKELFTDNGISAHDVELNDRWVAPINDINVKTHTGEYKKIVGYYINGYKDTIKIDTADDNIEATPNHKVLVKISETQAMWTPLSDIKVGDIILKY